MGFQQVVQPSGRRAFLKSDLQVSAQPVDKLQDHAGFGFDDRFHHYLAGRIPDSNRNAFLVNVHTDIFSTDHKGRPPLERLSEALKPYSTRGALLNCVECLARAGELEKAQLLFEKLLGYANHVGLYSEELGANGCHLGNFPQAFTHLALISAATYLDRALSGTNTEEWC